MLYFILNFAPDYKTKNNNTMRQTDKKQLREILKNLVNIKDDLEMFKDNHQEWIDEREDETDGRFSETETGERAEDDQTSFEEWFDNLQDLCDEIEENI